MIDVTVKHEGLAPEYAHPGDAGADLRALGDYAVYPGEVTMVRTGLKAAIPEGFFGLIASRSGLGTKYRISLANGVGVIDSGYRGEIQVGLMNHGRRVFTIESGDRVAQLILVPFVTAKFEAVDALDGSARGSRGFGSTGVQ